MDQPPQSVGVNDLPNCQLIIIDKNNKIKFFKKCQIVVTEGIKEIFFKPTDEDYKKINASFDRCFVCQGRIVCINNCEADPCKYVLIFRSKRVCSNVKALIEENNMNADAGTNVVNENYEEVFKEIFLAHINNECENDEEMEKKLFMTRYDLNNYYKLMEETNAIESTSTTDTPPTADENVDEDKEGNEFSETPAQETTTPNTSDTNQEEPANNNELNCEPTRNLRKRARKDKGFYGESDADNFDDLEDTDATTPTKKISPPSKRSKKNVQNLEGKIIKKTPDYQIMEEVFAGRNVKYLYVFDTADKNMCYKYTWNNYKKKFVCSSCKWKGCVWAKLTKDENGEECIQLGPKQHLCELRNFRRQTEADSNRSSDASDDNQNDDQEDVNEPNLLPYKIVIEKYGAKNVKHLYLFDAADKNMCYRYTWKNNKQRFICNSCNWKNIGYVWAKLVKDVNGEECIQLGPKQHSCELRKFQPQSEALQDSVGSSDSSDDFQNDDQEDVNEPNLLPYKIVIEKYGGRDVQHLYVFNENDKSLYYDLTWKQVKKKYICNRCMFKHHISVWAKLVKDENGEEILKQSQQEHKCELKQMNSMNNTI